MSATKKIHYLKDYQAPDFSVLQVDLIFDIGDAYTTVTSHLNIHPKHSDAPCVLDGSAELIDICLNNQQLTKQDYQQKDDQLIIKQVPCEDFILTITTRLYPQHNKSLMGLYASNGNLYTQCEAEGFRKITYYFDRPDVMSRFTTTIIANKTQYPVLLSNGDLVDSGEKDANKHWVKWSDPFAKPCYLFALVAGQLSVLTGTHTTMSGKKVTLKVYTRAEDQAKAHFALTSLQHAMQWDETRFGLEYDLSTYMVVAVSDFNMGAMENKGLNIFNTKYVLASTDTATDADFEAIESVIGHEYFHNWTGNRVTCRDWFQLSLKEGLTVFREQEFSADRASRAVRRIHNIQLLRSLQFTEDAGPMAHPVRPTSYEEINNFYTLTVYEKGAEVVRMYHTLLGEEGFQKGMRLYFQQHDGQAVTCDDFRQAMADANDVNLNQFALWYSQAGTPHVDIKSTYHPEQQTLTLHIQQTIPTTPDTSVQKQPMVIPIKFGLLNKQGKTIAFRLPENQDAQEEAVFVLTKQHQDFVLHAVNEPCVPSLFRGLSAPVTFTYPYTKDELILLLSHDIDAFSRWEAAQILYRQSILNHVDALKMQQPIPQPQALANAVVNMLNDDVDPAFKAILLQIPLETEVWRDDQSIDPTLYVAAKEHLLQTLSKLSIATLEQWYTWACDQEMHSYYPNTDESHPDVAGLRYLQNALLIWIMMAKPEFITTLKERYQAQAKNMTHKWGILSAINHSEHQERDHMLNDFAEQYEHDELVMDKYFTLVGSSWRTDTLSRVTSALQHSAFNIENPNKVRALLGSFGRNIRHFHAQDGRGYEFMANQILIIDAFNPQVAAHLLQSFQLYHQMEPQRQLLMGNQLQRIRNTLALSKDCHEIVSKIMN